MDRMPWPTRAIAVGLFLAACLGWPVRTCGSVPETPRPRMLGVADGLPSMRVQGLAQDRAGYVWIGTSDGLARHDGVGMRVWRHVPGQRAGLPGNYITTVHVDAADRVWVAVEGLGLSMLGPDRAGFRHYTRDTTPALASNDVFAIESRDGDTWLGLYDGGLQRLHRDGRVTRYTLRADDVRSLPSDTVLDLAFDARGTLWIATLGGLARWTPTGGMERVDLPGDSDARVFAVQPDGAGGLWVSRSGGVRHRAAGGRWRAPAWGATYVKQNTVQSFLADPDGGLWLGSTGGIWRAAPGAAAPVRVHLAGRAFMGRSAAAMRDRDGGLWFGTEGAGLGYLRPDWSRLAQLTHASGALVSPVVGALASGRANRVWLGGLDSHLQLLDPARDLRTDADSVRVLSVRNAQGLAEATDGAVWVGRTGGLERIATDGTRQRWTPTSARDAVAAGPIVHIVPGAAGSVWIAVQGAAIEHRDPSGRVVLHIPSGPSHGLGVGDIEALVLGPDGAPWIAGEGGVSRLDAGRGRFDPIPGMRGPDRVHAIAFDGADTVWTQTLGGLQRHVRRAGAWRRAGVVDRRHGLPAVGASALVVDGRHRVWISSPRGLFRWDPASSRLRRYGLEHGLSSQEFADRALVLRPDGVLAAVLGDGTVVLVDTRIDDAVAAPPALRVERLQTRRDGRWVDLGSTPTLTPDDRELRLGLRLLAFEDASAHRYFSRVDGVDADWSEHDTRGERILAGWPSGSHTVRVRAIDAAGQPVAGRPVVLTVQPPWWRTPWAALGALGTLSLLGWALADILLERAARRREIGRAAHEREVAEQASIAKTRFLATLGHEVRTPMTGVLGMSELLQGTPLDTTQRHYVDSIHRAGGHLMRLVNDALDLARIESGRFELDAAPFDLRRLVEDAIGLMKPLAERNGLIFETYMAPDAPHGLLGDHTRVCQVLLNLLGNAIKFTEHGHVRLRVSRAQPRGVRFEVADTGPGLSDVQLARLFRRFEQAEGARTTVRYGGSGLGLAICQEFAAAMGGSIDVDSTPGRGTRFVVTLPLADADPPVASDVVAPRGRPSTNRTILLVEDDSTVAQVVIGLLQARGHRVVHAAHGLAALGEAARGGFDIGLLDLDLPGMDGFDLARALHAQGLAMPLVAITARTDPDAELLADSAGFVRFIRKPMTGDMLDALIDDVLDSQPAGAGGATAGCATSP